MPSNQPEGRDTLLLMSGASQPGRPGVVKARDASGSHPHMTPHPLPPVPGPDPQPPAPTPDPNPLPPDPNPRPI